MLRLYDFLCSEGHTQEELIDTPPEFANIHCRKCGLPMRHTIGGRAHTFKPFWHPHLGHRPVHIESWKQYKQELQKRNLANELGS